MIPYSINITHITIFHVIFLCTGDNLEVKIAGYAQCGHN